jgi:hypothetical protein
MFAKIAKIRIASLRRAASRPLAHCNDDRVEIGAAVPQRRARRPVLACHWRRLLGGGLECRWSAEFADEAATEEPDLRWIIRRNCRLLGIEPAGGRLAVPAMP